MQQYASLRLQTILFPYKSKWMQWVHPLLYLLILSLLIIGISNPQIGIKSDKIKGRGSEVMILLDVSNSMLAQDIQPNRLERAKFFISKLLDQLHNDRVGLIIFAGNSFLQVPITIDYSAIKMNLPLINTSSVPSQGTAIGDAVTLAQESLGLTDSKQKGIVILTDGEDNDGEAEAAISQAKKNGIKVLAIGVGSVEGATIPMGNEVKRDENGQVVKTAFNQKMLENLATIGNGTFYHLGENSNIVEDVTKHIEHLENKEFEEFDYSNFNSYFYYFLIIALCLLLIYFILPSIQFTQFFKKIVILTFILFTHKANYSQSKAQKELEEKANIALRKGNSQFNNKNYTEAAVSFRKALSINPKDKVANYNLANTLYEQGKHKESIEQYDQSIKLSQDKISKAKSYHNIGNAYYKSNQTEEAIKAYENALKLNPNDMDTKFNLAMAKKKNKNNGGGGSGQSQNNPKNDGKDKDNKGQGNEPKEANGQPKNDPNGQPKDGENGDKPEPKKSGNMSKEQAEKLLEALKNQEQNTQNKVQRQAPKPEQKQHKKDW